MYKLPRRQTDAENLKLRNDHKKKKKKKRIKFIATRNNKLNISFDWRNPKTCENTTRNETAN